MGRKKQFKEPRRLTIVIDERMYQNLVRQAMYQGRMEGRILKVSDMVRRGLNECFPMNETMDMFA